MTAETKPKKITGRLRDIYQLSRRAFQGYKKQIILLVILGFIGGILEGVGVNALIPLFSFALGEGNPGTDIISRGIGKFFQLINLELSVANLLFLIIFLFLVKAGVTLLLHWIRITINADFELSIKKKLFHKIINSSWPHLMKQKLGYLETVFTLDVVQSAQLLNHFGSLIMIITGLLIYILVAINISFYITLLTLAVGLVVFISLSPLVKLTRRLTYQYVILMKQVAQVVNENIIGAKTVKTMGAIEKSFDRITHGYNKIRNLVIKITFLKNGTSSIIQPIGVIFICALFALTYQREGFNLAALVVIVYLIQRIFTHIQQMQKSFHSINGFYPHLKSVMDTIDQADSQQEEIGGQAIFNFDKSLVMNSVSFFYDNNQPVLKDINLQINKGEMVGLIGPSGVGKTTIVDLFLRLLIPITGEILLDGKNIKHISMASWRKHIGYVSQDIFLTNDSFKENIRFYDESISDEKIEQAAKLANIHETIIASPKGYEATVGDRGVKLSAGQRQRVVIARVLARQPDFLVLDEATSALDNESEVQIQQVIQNLKGKITVLIIAHRLSTIKDADRLIVLGDGRVIEQGTPKDLLKKKDSYFFKVHNIRDQAYV